MPWWAWALLGWAALSIPVAVVVGRAIRLGEAGGRTRPTGRARTSRPPEGEGSIDDLSA